jgi:glycerol kinase
MSDQLILAIDQGTTNTKAIALDATGRIVAQASVPMAVAYPQAGWAEQSAIDIWHSVQQVIAETVAKLSAPIAALAVSNQRETIVAWDASTGEPIGPAIIWQCRRSADRCAALRAAGHTDLVVERTGLTLDPLFPAAKLAWLLDEMPGARARAERGELRAGTIDSWLLWNLTGGAVHATDHSNASRTQLFDTQALAWSDELLQLFGVPPGVLPAVLPSDSRFGEVADGATALPAGTPIHAMMGDSHAALYGHGVRESGMAKATYGTGSSLMTLTGKRVTSQHGLSGTIAWSTSRRGVLYALEGNISVSGQAAAFMAEILGLEGAEQLSELAASVADTNGTVFVPALVGLGAPHWRADARGVIAGLSLGTKRAHIARAALEAIAFQVADVLNAMAADLGTSVSMLSVDGGASRNDFLMQFQADVANCTLARGSAAEVSAIGAASLAASGIGWGGIPQHGDIREFRPRLSERDREAALDRWRRAIAQTLRGSSSIEEVVS